MQTYMQQQHKVPFLLATWKIQLDNDGPCLRQATTEIKESKNSMFGVQRLRDSNNRTIFEFHCQDLILRLSDLKIVH